MIRASFALLITVLCLLSPLGAAVPVDRPVPIIFDTDMGNDIDDALALAMIHALESRRECKLLAVTLTKDNPYSASYVDLVNTFYGRGGIPIGAVRKGMTPEESAYIQQPSLAADEGRVRYPHRLKDGREAPEAVSLLRKVLAEQADGSVVMVQVGFFTNLARLLETRSDAISALDGKSLVRRKVRLLSVMAGSFSDKLAAKRYQEYNVKIDLSSAGKVFREWPTPVVASGFEIGEAVEYTAHSIEQDYAYVRFHPIAEAYRLYQKMPYDRPAWDLTSALYAVRPSHGYFDLSVPGRIQVEPDGMTSFHPSTDGPHRYLIVRPEQIIRAREAMEVLCSQPPGTM